MGTTFSLVNGFAHRSQTRWSVVEAAPSSTSAPAIFRTCPVTDMGRSIGRMPLNSKSDKSNWKTNGRTAPGTWMMSFRFSRMAHLA